ncbi:facilitated trehalose transporter Tret1-like [Pararge aegeria]|uniref:facilitated trehalose transporter Tret1-like n=1 Tax=Pararge aegeria TaxID=116150 RepID=UPI0019D144C2|nr:facilitated trehalose transporter Tret1-like [Pararge aegeria]
MGCLNDIYFWRQCIVLFANCMLSVGTGFMLSFPAVLNPDILSPNGTIHVTSDQASWIAGSNGFSGVFGFILVPHIMQVYGRKIVHIGLNCFYVLGFLILALAHNVYCLYAARIMQGIPMCGVFITTITVGEYSHPKRRGYFITIKKTAVAIGALMCHSLALCWTWKQIAAFAVIPNTLAILLTLMWPESPSFLVFNEKYDECCKSHIWLFGDSLQSQRNLEELVSNQMEIRKQSKEKNNLKNEIRKLLKKDFIKPFIIVSLLTMITDASGRFYMLAYIVQILTDVTKNKSIAAYCTIGSDVLTFTALLISCFVIRCCKRRTLLFVTGTTCAFLMCLTSLITFLKSHFNIGGSVYWWLTPLVILLNVFTINVGIVPAGFTILSEIFPLEHKGIGTAATGIVFAILYSIVMKCTPLMMEKTGVEGTFGIYAIHVIVGLLILYFILNETKDKTLQQIENEIKGIKHPGVCYSNEKPLISA